MTFWQWFKQDGDQIFVFLSLVGLGLQALGDAPHWMTQTGIVMGIIATAAHRSFFPAQPGPSAPKAD